MPVAQQMICSRRLAGHFSGKSDLVFLSSVSAVVVREREGEIKIHYVDWLPGEWMGGLGGEPGPIYIRSARTRPFSITARNAARG